jgi:transposase-like protein
MQPKSPSSVFEFQRRFATEEACERYLFAWRWPKGFECPRCQGRKATRLRNRPLYQCTTCYHQASVTAGTALHKSKLPLPVWFWAIFLVARHKKGISALQLQADLGLGSYRTAWLLLHKIRRCFGESEAFPLRGLVEVDETYVGGVEPGALHGRAAGGKRIVVAAVEVRRRHLGALRMRAVGDAKKDSLLPFVSQNVERGATVATDGWAAYNALEGMGYRRERHVAYPVRNALPRPILRAVHLVFSNLKTWLRGRFHGVSGKYLPAYLDEFSYRFNRRRSPRDLFGWVTRRLVTRPPQTLLGIRGAEAGA